MKKAIVTLIKRQIIDSSTTNDILMKARSMSHEAVRDVIQYNRVSQYTLVEHKRTELKKTVDSLATTGNLNIFLNLNRYIPDFWDTSNRINLQMQLSLQDEKFPKSEVISYNEKDKETFEMAIYLETESLILLDNIGDKLLLAFPSKIKEEDASKTVFQNTFFIRLTDDIYFGEYTIL